MRVISLLVVFALGGIVSISFQDYLRDQKEFVNQIRKDVEQVESLCNSEN